MEINLEIGLSGEKSELVTNENTAVKYGSGDVPVYATPALVGLMEGASINAADRFLPAGFCTVGIRMVLDHTAATPLGMTVTARSRLVQIDGRRLVFEVEASDERESVGKGMHERFIVQMDKFMSRVSGKQG